MGETLTAAFIRLSLACKSKKLFGHAWLPRVHMSRSLGSVSACAPGMVGMLAKAAWFVFMKFWKKLPGIAVNVPPPARLPSMAALTNLANRFFSM